MKKFLSLLLALVSVFTLCFTLTACGDGSTKSLTYELLEDGTYCVTGITGTDTKVVVPEKKDGKSVTQIGEDAFRNNSYIVEVVLPASVTKINDSAFQSTTKLEVINLDKVEQIGKNAFKTAFVKAATVEINLASIMSMGNGCFQEAMGIKTLTIGGTLTNVPKNAFASCSGLRTLVLGSKVKKLEEKAFTGCSSLSSISMDKVKYIGEECFNGCGKLTTLNMPSIEEIKDRAFNNCGFITDVTCGPNLKQLFPLAFYSCASLTTFTLTNPVASEWCYAMVNANTSTARITDADSCQGSAYKHLLNDPTGFATRIRSGSFNTSSCWVTKTWVEEHGLEVGSTYAHTEFL